MKPKAKITNDKTSKLLGDNKRKPRVRNEEAIKLVGNNMRKIRESKGLSMEKLAFLMDVDYAQVANMEHGRTDPSLSMLLNAADKLQVTLAQLLDKN